MTSPARGGPDTARMREALYRALVGVAITDTRITQVLDRLLPAVQRLAAEKAAEELRAAADDVPRFSPALIAKWLRDRADALAAAAQPTDGRTGV